MAVPATLRRVNKRIDRWFRAHVVIWWLVLACIPGGAYAGEGILSNDGAPGHAVALGAVFGVTFATITVGIQRLRRN